MRDELLSPKLSDEDTNFNSEVDMSGLRPNSLKDFVGQTELKEHLEIILGAAKKREDTLKMAEANRAFSHYRW